MTKGKRNVTHSLDTEIYDIFQECCDRHKLSYSQVIETLLLYFIEKEEQEMRRKK